VPTGESRLGVLAQEVKVVSVQCEILPFIQSR
jgi:hypothetical protein